MLYETSARKSGTPPANAAPRIVKPQPANAGVKKPAAVAVPAKVQATRLKTPVVKGWPSAQKNMAKQPMANRTGRSPLKQAAPAIQGTTKRVQASVKGWPSRQQSVIRNRNATAARPPHYKPAAAHLVHHSRRKGATSGVVTGWPQRKHGIHQNQVPVIPAKRHHHHHHPKRRPGYVPITGWLHHNKRGYRRPWRSSSYPAANTTYYTDNVVPAPVYANGVAVQQSPQGGGWSTNGAQQHIPSQNINAPSAGQPVCHTCGSGAQGCIVLSRFAFNSAVLNQNQINQIRVLASRILGNNLNAIIATGHTDSNGTEDYNEALGSKRAAAVVVQLKKQLKMLKPGSHRNIFWKTDSKGETEPLAQNDAAANRRVELCLRKINLVA